MLTRLRTTRYRNLKHRYYHQTSIAYKKVAVAVDGSPESILAVQRALGQVTPTDSLYLVHVQQTPMMYDAINQSVAEEIEKTYDTIKSKTEQSLRDKLATTIQVQDYELVCQSGAPGNVICKFIKDNDVDLLVIGERGLGLARRILGSIVNYCVHNAPCDVLVVKKK
eukprot:TRINITY_DN8698_c0_g1_i1.p1 TRINITY_DN8698_c0_g1~~TRINITY_DN8698_c0_g1_i1.p1  ORF type:complete len:167 (+),score=30.58 TRINITY_DN8698_c0_g1_i1:80-580(+)